MLRLRWLSSRMRPPMTRRGHGSLTPSGRRRAPPPLATALLPCPHPSHLSAKAPIARGAMRLRPPSSATSASSLPPVPHPLIPRPRALAAMPCPCFRLYPLSAASPRSRWALTRGAHRVWASPVPALFLDPRPATRLTCKNRSPKLRPGRSGASSAASKPSPSSSAGRARATQARATLATSCTGPPCVLQTRHAFLGVGFSSTPRGTFSHSAPSRRPWVRRAPPATLFGCTCRANTLHCLSADAMAANKLNVLHWHISDDQRFAPLLPPASQPPAAHPDLTISFRQARSFPLDVPHMPGFAQRAAFSPGAVYTHRDVSHVVGYARGRGIRVLPGAHLPLLHTGERAADAPARSAALPCRTGHARARAVVGKGLPEPDGCL